MTRPIPGDGSHHHKLITPTHQQPSTHNRLVNPHPPAKMRLGHAHCGHQPGEQPVGTGRYHPLRPRPDRYRGGEPGRPRRGTAVRTGRVPAEYPAQAPGPQRGPVHGVHPHRQVDRGQGPRGDQRHRVQVRTPPRGRDPQRAVARVHLTGQVQQCRPGGRPYRDPGQHRRGHRDDRAGLTGRPELHLYRQPGQGELVRVAEHAGAVLAHQHRAVVPVRPGEFEVGADPVVHRRVRQRPRGCERWPVAAVPAKRGPGAAALVDEAGTEIQCVGLARPAQPQVHRAAGQGQPGQLQYRVRLPPRPRAYPAQPRLAQRPVRVPGAARLAVQAQVQRPVGGRDGDRQPAVTRQRQRREPVAQGALGRGDHALAGARTVGRRRSGTGLSVAGYHGGHEPSTILVPPRPVQIAARAPGYPGTPGPRRYRLPRTISSPSAPVPGRYRGVRAPPYRRRRCGRAGHQILSPAAVSYTHLTLPTIYSV